MKPVRLVVGSILAAAAVLSLLVALIASGLVLSVGVRDTCTERVATPVQTALDDDGRLAIEARGRLPFGIDCAYRLQDGGEHVEYVEVGTAPTIAFLLLASAGTIALVPNPRNRKPRIG